MRFLTGVFVGQDSLKQVARNNSNNCKVQEEDLVMEATRNRDTAIFLLLLCLSYLGFVLFLFIGFLHWQEEGRSSFCHSSFGSSGESKGLSHLVSIWNLEKNPAYLSMRSFLSQSPRPRVLGIKISQANIICLFQWPKG